MLTEAKNQFKISMLSVKYAIMREMLNKTTFLTNIIFMILNNASFIIQWLVLYSLKDNVGGYTFKQVMLLWALAASTFGIAHLFFKKAFELSDMINTGKLDSFLVQPKNVLLSAITTDVDTSALGDILYGFLMLFICGTTPLNILLFIIFSMCGGFILVSLSVILSSLSFWFNKTDVLSDTVNRLMTNFATYPDGIFKGAVKVMLYTIIPVGITTYIPVRLLTEFNFNLFILIIVVTIILVALAFIIFNKGLKRYSSSNLMSARV